MAEKLAAYRGKRDFGKTAEPRGSRRKRAREGGIFAVQYHAATGLHYDLRLEWGGVLLSWAVPKGPSLDPRDKRLAVKVEDHPIEYAAFEGTIPKGQYGGGTVMLWDEGTFRPDNDFAAGLKSGSLKFTLYGRRLQGKWALVRIKDDADERQDNWLLIKESDEYARDDAGIASYKTGVRSGRTFDEIASGADPKPRKNPIKRVTPQLAKLADEIPVGEDWLFEIKYDGYRILSYSENGGTQLLTRNGIDFTDKFAEIADAIDRHFGGRPVILDGEMVIADADGKTDFQALQQYVKQPSGKRLQYMVFDMPAFDGEDLRKLPLVERKKRLEQLLQNAPPSLSYSAHVVGRGQESFEAAAALGLEGIVAKRVDSIYRGDRNGDWLKLKCYRRQEFVVGGYTRTVKKAAGVSALLLGVYRGDRFEYIGRAGTGIDRRAAAELSAAFQGLETDKSPFAKPPRKRAGEQTFWLKPQRVVEVQFAEITDEFRLRQAGYKGLRVDEAARDVVVERTPADATEVCGVEISSPDKVVYQNPTVVKREVIAYYAAAAERMLSYIGGRVLSVVRCHKGVSAACFFKKHPTAAHAGMRIVPVKNSEGETSDYFCIVEASGLIAEAQQGSLEFHVWGSRADTLESPDMLVFDLDPDEGLPLDRVRQGVRDLKKLLTERGLQCFLKTSGGKGYHVVVPLEPKADWTTFRAFARETAYLMESRWPDRYTANSRKNKRGGKIFIDWGRNTRGATGVAPYSLRARPGARVSMPIAWRELDTVAPDGIDIFEAQKRLRRADPWKGFFTVKQRLQ